jgi:hypothetical protein
MSETQDLQEPKKIVKKISGEYFKDNRKFVKMPVFLQDYIKKCIEPQRQEKASLAEHLANAQKESRKKKFGQYGIDMPLPELKKEMYLSKVLPIDAFLYVLYGAILWEKPTGMEISRDARDLMEYEYLKHEENTAKNMKEKGKRKEQNQPKIIHKQNSQKTPWYVKLLCGITLGVVGLAILLALFYFLH